VLKFTILITVKVKCVLFLFFMSLKNDVFIDCTNYQGNTTVGIFTASSSVKNMKCFRMR